VLVRMRTDVSGLRNGQPWPPRGGTVELPDDEAAQMCAAGTAEPVHDPESGVERAVVDDVDAHVERREALVDAPKKRGRPRKAVTG
jgi:hypothetical protein